MLVIIKIEHYKLSKALTYFFKERVVMTIGEACRIRIIELCNDRGITPNRLAIMSSITQSTLNNVISERNNSTIVSMIKKLCDGLEISVLDFFGSDIFFDLEQEIK